ncbi:hypothetical protein D3C78_1680860 [compost metagenome]
MLQPQNHQLLFRSGNKPFIARKLVFKRPCNPSRTLFGGVNLQWHFEFDLYDES